MNPNLVNPYELYFKELNSGGSGIKRQKRLHNQGGQTQR